MKSLEIINMWFNVFDQYPMLRHVIWKTLISSSYMIACPPVRGDNPRALAMGLSSVQADKIWYNFFIPPSPVKTLLSLKYFVIKFVISGQGDIIGMNLNLLDLIMEHGCAFTSV